MAPRPSSAASSETGHQRMPFVHAEALLWWPELRKQHEWLLTEMRALQTQHDAYNNRIQTTEAVAEAAEAAISRIRHIEQQIVAIEADDKDKAFEKWTAEEITRLKIFVDRNQTVRQKQIELEKRWSSMTEDLGKLKDASVDLKSVQRRLDVYEATRKQDAEVIRALEQKVASLEAVPRIESTRNTNFQANMNTKSSSRPRAPTPVQIARESEESSETEDEGPTSPDKPPGEQIQVPRSPGAIQHIQQFEPSTTNTPPAISARLRLLKRPSIHNSKIIKAQYEDRNRAARRKQNSILPDLLATLPANRANPKKQDYPINALYTERVTRSQIKNQLRIPQQPITTAPTRLTVPEPTKKPTMQQQNVASRALVKKTAAQATQPTTTTSAKRKRPVGPEINQIIPPQSTEPVTGSSPKRKKPNNVPVAPAVNRQVGNTRNNGVVSSSALLPNPPAATRSRRRAMPDITDYETYLKLRAEAKIP